MGQRRRAIRGRACLVSIMAVALIAIVLGALVLAAGMFKVARVVVTQKGGGGVEAGATIEKTLPAAGVTSLKVSVRAGEIQVFTDGGDSLRLTAQRTVKESTGKEAQRALNQTSVEFIVNGSEAVLRDVVPETWPWKGPHNVRLVVELHVPARLAASLDMGAGTITAQGEYTSLAASSGAGSVETSGVTCSGDFAAKTGAGGVKVSKLVCSSGRAVVTSGAGEVEAGFAALPPGGVEASSGAGSVTLLLPPDAKASIAMDTSVGAATSEFPQIQPQGTLVGKQLTGDLNGGGPKVSAHTGTGTVSLRQLPANP